MKKYTAYKSVQLIIFILISAAIIFRLFYDKTIFHEAATDPGMKFLCLSLWIVLGLLFLFIYLDYTFFFHYIRDYREMETAVRSDPLSGVANRFSCDVLIEKYLGKELPENMGCMMFEITNIREINQIFGRAEGNSVIRDFSNMLTLSSAGLCFIGRNGGNKFLTIFENTDEEKMLHFSENVEMRVKEYNADTTGGIIKYSFGSAFHEDPALAPDITALISLSDSRIGEAVSGIEN